MRKTVSLLVGCLCLTAFAQKGSYRFTGKVAIGETAVATTDRYTPERGYGFDYLPSPTEKTATPFYFSVKVPDGNYRVTVHLGSKKYKGETTVRAESRRLFLEQITTKKGEICSYSFVVNKRSPYINEKESVRIKPREQTKLNWDEKLTLEFNGDAPACIAVEIEPVDVPTIYLAGNSTVVDQDEEPWASWGQMIPRFLNGEVAVANYAESGESASSFISGNRLKRALRDMKEGDYIFVEFGHNDQKQNGPGKGAYYSYATTLKTFIDEARLKGATPVLVTPTQRRRFDGDKISDTHGEFPAAMRWVAAREKVKVIDLHEMTRTLFEALGVEDSKKALVHYPANTYPNQTTPLADNTHFNPYGAYQIAQCVIEGIKANELDLMRFIRTDYSPYTPASPDSWKEFVWHESSFADVVKPDGN